MTTNHNINVDEMREAIVGGNTYYGYKYDIIKIIETACNVTMFGAGSWKQHWVSSWLFITW